LRRESKLTQKVVAGFYSWLICSSGKETGTTWMQGVEDLNKRTGTNSESENSPYLHLAFLPQRKHNFLLQKFIFQITKGKLITMMQCGEMLV
jgi:hypothetical protein